MADDTTPPDNSTDSGKLNDTSETESAEQKDVDSKSGNDSGEVVAAIETMGKTLTASLSSLGTMIKEIPSAVASATNIQDKDSPEAGKETAAPKEGPPKEKEKESPEYKSQRMHAGNAFARWWHGDKG